MKHKVLLLFVAAVLLVAALLLIPRPAHSPAVTAPTSGSQARIQKLLDEVEQPTLISPWRVAGADPCAGATVYFLTTPPQCMTSDGLRFASPSNNWVLK